MEIKWYQLLFQIVNFGILVFVLKKFLYQPIISIINLRNKKIEDSIRAAEATLKEKATLDELKKKSLAEAEKEATRIVENARKKAGQDAKSIVETAKVEAEAEVDKKLKLLQEKLGEEEARITGRITELVVKATTQVLKGSLTETEQRKIIDQEIKKLSRLAKSK